MASYLEQGSSYPNSVFYQNQNSKSYLNESKYSHRSSATEKIQYYFKVVLAGDIAVGKSAIFTRYTKQTFISTYQCSLNADNATKVINLDDSTEVQLELWDTAGEEKFKAITSNYFKGAHGILLSYDLTSQESFSNLSRWIDTINDSIGLKSSCIALVGNKADLERKVSDEKIQHLANQYNFMRIEVSAKTGLNIDLLFEKMVKEMMKRSDEEIATEKPEENWNRSKMNITNKTKKTKRERNSVSLKDYKKTADGKKVSCC